MKRSTQQFIFTALKTSEDCIKDVLALQAAVTRGLLVVRFTITHGVGAIDGSAEAPSRLYNINLPLNEISAARGRPIIVEWERDARHSAGLSLVR
ncbi:hypothetical protein EVAR_52724_1 [Eumeta japonica]|uniref:Uncharacterized protein n=1 Tax=Eumeta variegata TaxID=151549 RepID=A0A4C1ZEW8_EUMVA|nr:hypothetical protein EVAR_52724_1 [Eumeta japonica]